METIFRIYIQNGRRKVNIFFAIIIPKQSILRHPIYTWIFFENLELSKGEGIYFKRNT